MTTSSKAKSSKEYNDSLPLDTRLKSPIFDGNKKYVPDPPMQEEKLRIYKF